jgi:hypothetical protein
MVKLFLRNTTDITYMFNKKTFLLFFLFITAIPTSFAQLKHSFEEVEQLSTENQNSLSCLFILPGVNTAK